MWPDGKNKEETHVARLEKSGEDGKKGMYEGLWT